MNPERARTLHRQMEDIEVGGWLISELIGSGGSAAVFVGTRGDQEAAIKVIDPDLVSEFGLANQKARIDAEGGLVGHGHTNLIEIIEASQCSVTGYLYVAMPRLHYTKLSQVIGNLPREAIKPLIQQVASAAEFLQTKELCHRDIKPDNVMISKDYSHAVLMDLGIISPFGSEGGCVSDPSGERFIGTARYCPPEFVRKSEDRGADGCRALTFYQLGGLLHDMIMRKRLFSDIAGPYALLLDAISVTLPVIESEEVQTHLVHLARDCLEKKTEQRLALVDFDRFLKGEQNVSLSARERVKAALSADGGGPMAAPVRAGLGRDVYNRLARHLRDQLRAVCTSNEELLHPSVDYDGSADCARLRAEFEPSLRHNIGRAFSIVFEARSLPTRELTFTLDAHAEWTHSADSKGDPERTRVCIIRGLEDDVAPYLEDVVYRTMAAAMAQPEAASATALKIGE